MTVCRLGAAAQCLLRVPVEHFMTRDRLGTVEDAEIDAETRASMSKGLPWSAEIKLSLAIDPSGVATVKKLSEKGSPRVDLGRYRAHVGQVKLW